MKFISSIYDLLTMFVSWFLNIFKSKPIIKQTSVWDQLARKDKPLNPVKWNKMIHKLKSKNGQGKGFKHFGTFSPVKPFMYRHKAF